MLAWLVPATMSVPARGVGAWISVAEPAWKS